MIGNNACGAHSVAWGTTAANLRGLRVVTGTGDLLDLQVPDGPRDRAALAAPGPLGALQLAHLDLAMSAEHLIRDRFGTFARQISGYSLEHLLPERGVDLVRLLCGSEGTLASTLTAQVALVQVPPAVVLLALGFPDAIAAADSIPLLLPHNPLTVESINATLVDRLPADVRARARAAGLPTGSTWLLVELGADEPEAARALAAELAGTVRDGVTGATASVVAEPDDQAVLWRCRRDGTGLATRRADGAEAWAGWEDAAVPPQRLGEYLRGLDELLARYGYSGASYGHFGEGCMHMRIDFDLISDDGVARYRSFVEQAADLVAGLGGSVSGEHGDGRARSGLLARMYPPEAMALFAAVKGLWDPSGLLNPRVIVDPPPADAALRFPRPHRDLTTLLAFPSDDGSFAQAQRRCVGVAKCRQSSGGVMCPSFQATGDETHSTRGRAHLLAEMLRGELVTDGWRSTEVRDALDLCLSCKGCLSDCPVNVDMATYKAEFTHQHYRGRPWARPRSHWSMGWLPTVARLAGRLPRITNALTGSPLAPLLKRAGGIAPERTIPRFAEQTFADWFASRRSPVTEAPNGPVLLWPDSFTNYLAPGVGRAAVAVLEAAGFEVRLPAGGVCCGLTWVSTGQLSAAQRVLRRSLGVIAPELRAGIPVVGLEPSCTALFRHEAVQLLPDEPLAAAARAQVRTLAEVLTEQASDWRPPPVAGDALMQVHCHQHAVLGSAADRALLAEAGVAVTVPDAGCCGLAGNFGFEVGHYEISMAVGERALLPAVRHASESTTILADGFSCRTQIAQGTPRRARHLAELLAAGLADPT